MKRKSKIKNQKSKIWYARPAKPDVRLKKRSNLLKKTKFNYFSSLKKLVAILLMVEGITLLGQTVYFHGPEVSQFLKKKVENAVASIRSEPNNHFGTVEVLKETLSQQKESVHPKKILIPKIGLEQPVEEGTLTNGQWDISERGASFMVGSCAPGNSCNIVIYGHAKAEIFGPLKKIKLNDMITVLTDKSWYSYRVTDILEVTPDQISVIGPTPDETLTLFTCSAFLDSKRLVVIAKRT